MRKFTESDKAAANASRQMRKSPQRIVAESTIDLLPAHRQGVLNRVAAMPETCRMTYLAGRKGDSPTNAIKAFCQMCVGWQDMAENIRGCTDPACPLYANRPYQIQGDTL
ncbi:MAG: hypothetical protein WCK05_10000 [Planctomycetota bacterium]